MGSGLNPIQVMHGENPYYVSAVTEAQSAFLCGMCDAALHFQVQKEITAQCSICNQECKTGTIVLVCDSCGLCICCNEAQHLVQGTSWKSSCYNSYFDPDESIRERLYSRKHTLSQYNTDDQQRWLQCMWHDISQNITKFRAELQHASQVEATSSSNVKLIIQNLGVDITKNLVRLFVTFQTKVDSETTEWFSCLIQREHESLGRVAMEASVSLRGRLEQVKWLVRELRLDASHCNLSGALGIVAKKGWLDILEWVIEHADADPSSDDNFAIREASGNGHLNVVQRLLSDERVDPSADDNDALRYACACGHLNVVERLLQDDRVDPAVYDSDTLQEASMNGHLNVVERLLQDDRVDPAADDNRSIQEACRNGHLNVVDRLLSDDRVNPAEDESLAIRLASQSGHLNVVERLLSDDRVDPSADDNCAIRWASQSGHLNVVERLLSDDRVNPAEDESLAIRLASQNGHLNVVERLLSDDRVDPCADDNCAIRWASQSGHLNVVERLLSDDRVDPSADDNCAIRWASQSGHLNVVARLLSDDRVDPSADDNCAIRWASQSGHLNVVERLLQDARVDPAAQRCEAIRTARDSRIIECLYHQTRRAVCYMFEDESLMDRLLHVHNVSLMIGGVCLTRKTILPHDVIYVILGWASLVNMNRVVDENKCVR